MHGLKLPAMGVGCWAFGGGKYWGNQNQRDVEEVVRGALEAGCNYFDTAEAYNDGASESSLGAALKGLRQQALIGTKISPANTHPATLREHCEASLRRLQTDFIDLYMIHWPIHPHSIRHFTDDQSLIANPPGLAEACETLRRLQDEGKIRHLGVSNFGVARMQEIAPYCEIAVNELPYSLLTRAIEAEALPYCRRQGIGVIGYMTLLQGLLADIFATLRDVPSYQRRTRHFHHAGDPLCRHGEEGAEAETNDALAAIRTIAVHEGLTMPQLALKWALAGDGITCGLVGARNLKELQENVQAASLPLERRVVQDLNQATQPLLRKLGPSFDYYESTANDRTR